jgi:hypothetical protein
MTKRRMKLRWQFVRAVCMGVLTTIVIAELLAAFWHPTTWNAVNQPAIYPSPPAYLGELVPAHSTTVYMSALFSMGSGPLSEVSNTGIDFYEFTYNKPRPDTPADGIDIPSTIVLTRYRSGWPWRAMYWDSVYIFNSGQFPNAQSYAKLMSDRAGFKYGLDIPLSSSWMRLPVMPVWNGLLLNVLLWSVLWSIPGPLRYGVRRYRRKRRGLCLACGYAVEDLEICPECGTDHAAC